MAAPFHIMRCNEGARLIVLIPVAMLARLSRGGYGPEMS